MAPFSQLDFKLARRGYGRIEDLSSDRAPTRSRAPIASRTRVGLIGMERPVAESRERGILRIGDQLPLDPVDDEDHLSLPFDDELILHGLGGNDFHGGVETDDGATAGAPARHRGEIDEWVNRVRGCNEDFLRTITRERKRNFGSRTASDGAGFATRRRGDRLFGLASMSCLRERERTGRARTQACVMNRPRERSRDPRDHVE